MKSAAHRPWCWSVGVKRVDRRLYRRQRTPIGGLVGQVTLAGDLAPLRELLVWGSLIHVGKNAVKGDGWYMIMGDGR